MRLLNLTRRLGAAGALLAAFAAAPALAQANLSVTLRGPLTGAPVPPSTAPTVGNILVGGENPFEVVITNAAGADAATGVTLTVTVAAPLEIDGFEGCTQSPTAPTTCTLPAAIPPGDDATVTVIVTRPVPDPLPATCPTTDTVGPVSVSVQATNDTTPATAAIASIAVDPYADLAVTVTPPSPNISSGETQTIRAVVKNNGPCTAEGAAVEFSFPTALGFQSATDTTQGGTFCAGGVPLDAEEENTATDDGPDRPAGAFLDLGCDLGDLPRDAERSFDAVFQLAQLPDDLIRGAYPFAVTAAADTHESAPANNTEAAPGRFEDDDDGCSTGGAGTLVSLLGLAALRLVRRRSA